MNIVDVSIIVPLYNRASLITETLQSLQSQTHSNWEAIVVDDGSTDASYQIAEDIAQEDSRIKIIKRYRDPKGAPTCRNIGLEHATGKYILFLDSDDLLAPFCIEKRLQYAVQSPNMDFIVFPMLLFKKQVNDTDIIWNIDTPEDDLLRFLRMDAVWQTSCPIYKKEAILRIGGFDEHLPFLQDYELHMRALIMGLTYEKQMDITPDCYLRRHENESISQKGFTDESSLKVKEYILNKIINLLESNKQNNITNYYQPLAIEILHIAKGYVEYGKLDKALNYWLKTKTYLEDTLYQKGIIYLEQYQNYLNTHSCGKNPLAIKQLEYDFSISFFLRKTSLNVIQYSEYKSFIYNQSITVSIIVPIDKITEKLSYRINNILNQTFPFFEVLLVTNYTQEELSFIAEQDSRIKIVSTNTKNYFKYWEQGIIEAKGEYIWIAELNNWAQPNFLLESISQLRLYPSSGLIYCQSLQKDKDNHLFKLWDIYIEDSDKKNWENNSLENGTQIINHFMIYYNSIPSSSAVVFKKNLYHDTDGIDNEFSINASWILWIKMLSNSNVVYLSNPLNYSEIQTEIDGKILEENIRIIIYILKNIRNSYDLRQRWISIFLKQWVDLILKKKTTWKINRRIHSNLKKINKNINKLLLRYLLDNKYKLLTQFKQQFL